MTPENKWLDPDMDEAEENPVNFFLHLSTSALNSVNSSQSRWHSTKHSISFIRSVCHFYTLWISRLLFQFDSFSSVLSWFFEWTHEDFEHAVSASDRVCFWWNLLRFYFDFRRWSPWIDGLTWEICFCRWSNFRWMSFGGTEFRNNAENVIVSALLRRSCWVVVIEADDFCAGADCVFL